MVLAQFVPSESQEVEAAMENGIPHDLHDFMRQVSAEIAAACQRIRSQVEHGQLSNSKWDKWSRQFR